MLDCAVNGSKKKRSPYDCLAEREKANEEKAHDRQRGGATILLLSSKKRVTMMRIRLHSMFSITVAWRLTRKLLHAALTVLRQNMQKVRRCVKRT